MKNFVKKFWVVPVSILLLFMLLSIGMMMVYLLLSITDNTLVSYAIPCVATGAVSAFPIIVKVAKSKQIFIGIEFSDVFCTCYSGF